MVVGFSWVFTRIFTIFGGMAGGEESSAQCNACWLRFKSFELLRKHYKEPLHEFNLKRRAKDLKPLSPELFAAVVRKAAEKKRAEGAAAAGSRKELGKSWVCKLTGRRFGSKAQYEQHLRSKKYKLALEHAREAKEEGSGEGSGEEEEKEVLPDELDVEEFGPEKRCLFCMHPVESEAEMLAHAAREHSFFLPWVDCIVDRHGLLQYLSGKVLGGFECLHCGKGFSGWKACQKHMLDVGHCRLPVDVDGGEAMIEYEDYFDFSKLPRRFDDSVGTGGEGVTELDGGEIRLPSGAILGHRSLRRIYKQRIHLDIVSVDEEMARREQRARLLPPSEAAAAAAAPTFGESTAIAAPRFTRRKPALIRRVELGRDEHRHAKDDMDLTIRMRNNKVRNLREKLQVLYCG